MVNGELDVEERQGPLRNPVQDKSYALALAVVRLYPAVRALHGGVLARQMLRAGTSVGANVEEALAGQSRRDFTAKMSIAAKEVRECSYWLRLLRDSDGVPSGRVIPIIDQAEELIRMLTAIVKTAQQRVRDP